MATIVGQGDYKYEIVEDWAQLPDGVQLAWDGLRIEI